MHYNVTSITGVVKWGYLPNRINTINREHFMDEKMYRSPGGKLALWLFYAFCGYFAWAMVRYFWVVSHVQSIPGATVDGDWGTMTGKWLGALLGFLVLSTVTLLLGALAWYTRPRQADF